jgi:uracil phosphoribosyltransferase
VYFEEVPDCLLHHPENQKVLVMDPMLATGNTTNTVLHRLADHGVPQENTFIVSVISAPEGVDNVLQKYPGVRIFAGRHDEGLNKEGYIIPGLGDYGDMSFEGLDRVQVAAWRDKEILSSRAATALLDRMAGRC